MEDVRLEIEELEQRVVPSTLDSTLSVTVEVPAESGIEAPAPTTAVDDDAATADGADGVSVG